MTKIDYRRLINCKYLQKKNQNRASSLTFKSLGVSLFGIA